MKLDRHNYEEFFLLYVDNELTNDQRKAVEQFVSENPDLEMELEILQQTVLPADDHIVFTNKQMLLKNESASLITMNNYEEYLISYLDNELNTEERIEFEKFVASYPQVKEELAIYQQTKLQPEKSVVFANKEVLYRKEEKVRVISIQWRRVAVAAAVLLVAGIGTIAVLNKKDASEIENGVAVTKPANTEKTNPASTDNNTSTQAVEENSKSTIEEGTIDNSVASTANETKNQSPLQEESTANPVTKKINTQQVRTDANSIALVDAPVKKQSSTTTVDIANPTSVENRTSPTVKETIELKNTIAATDKNTANQNSDKNTVTNADEIAYNNKEVDHIDQEKFNDLYASDNESKNRKLRGFFRKATRVFEKRTNISATDDNEDKVLIGALAVKLK